MDQENYSELVKIIIFTNSLYSKHDYINELRIYFSSQKSVTACNNKLQFFILFFF